MCEGVTHEGRTELAGRVALVTGAAQGIGYAVATMLAKAGATVVLSDLAAEEPDMTGIEGGAYMVGDVTNAEAMDRVVGETVARFGGLHILINNAGIAIDGLLLRMKQADWEKTLQVNLTGAYVCCKAASRHLLKAKSAGRIVNISSVVGEQGNAGQVAYAASKAGLIGLTRTLAREFASRGVTVNAVAPGFVETRMTAEHISEQQQAKLLEMIPLGRMGSVADIAEAVRFLCSPSADYITGQVLRVNGGLYM